MNSPGYAPSAPVRSGCTEPRLFTPELRPLTPETSWGFECITFLEDVLKWNLLPWQKWLYVHALEKDAAGTAFRYQTIVLLVARQNGKSQWLKGLGLWKLYMDGAEQVLISAQNLEMAETMLTEVVADIKNNRLLRREFSRFSQTNGKFKLVLKGDPRREWRAAVSNRKGGRSLSADLAQLDELREQQNWLAWNAIVPTTTARPRSLVVCASNAGDATSVVLRSLRDGAIQKIVTGETTDTKTFLAEWSAPDDVAHDDPEFWPVANPAMGHLPGFTEDSLRGRLEAMHDNVPGFKTEHLCQWVAAIEPGVFPADKWAETTDPGSRRAPDADVWAALDINFQRSKAYVAIAARREDGNMHVEVVKADRGTEWVVDWFTERAERFKSVIIQARGAPASGFIDELRDAGVPVTELGGADLTKAYGFFYDQIVNGKAFHRPSPVLDAAAEVAKPKVIGDSWVIDRKNSPIDASPLVACIQAAAGEMLREEQFISAYEDSDFVVL
jgi:hypothetical protein